MARKYNIHKYYSLICYFNDKGPVKFDDLTLREAKKIVSTINWDNLYHVEIIKRLYAENKTRGVIDLEKI